MPEEFGGYFGLELPSHGDPFPTLHKFQSASAALRALIEQLGLAVLALPHYTCDTVIEAVEAAGASIRFYHLDQRLLPKSLPNIGEAGAFFYINYFGLCGHNVSRLLRSKGSASWIIDNSQALLTAPSPEALASIYSPRKFVGLPDGGLLAVDPGLGIKEPADEDQGSWGRTGHLLRRLAYSAASGYSDFLAAEKSLRDSAPLAMSRLTRRLLAGIDMVRVRTARRANFRRLAQHLDAYNTRSWSLGAKAVPLCYPLVLARDVASLRAQLIEQGVYTPTYWPEVTERTSPDSFEHSFTIGLLAVPCDQRYTPEQMDTLGRLVAKQLA